jgi:hypothetical protein
MLGSLAKKIRITWGGQIKKEVVYMELVPWRPFGELSSFRDEMDKLWNRTFGERPFAGRLTEE